MTFGGNYWLATAGAHEPHRRVEGRGPDPRRHRRCRAYGRGGGNAAGRTLGVEAVLVEAETIGSGASSKPGGFRGAALSRWVRRAKSCLVLGDGRRGRSSIWSAIRRAGSTTWSATTGLDCEARQDGWYHPAHSRKALNADQVNSRRNGKNGANRSNFSMAKQPPGPRESAGYWGSLFAPTGGTVHPLKLTRAMAARCASERGVASSMKTRLLSKSGKEAGHR